MSTDRLVQFLNARVDEDEHDARAAIQPQEMHPYGDVTLPGITPQQVPDEVRGYLGGTWGEHFARHDPARVLADVQAKRRILAELLEEKAGIDRDGLGSEMRAIGRFEGLEMAAEILANAYADHPAFEQAWLADVSPAKVREHDV